MNTRLNFHSLAASHAAAVKKNKQKKQVRKQEKENIN